jgi:hypothetical protein
MDKRKVLSVVGVIVLGALGSGLWELAKPALASAATAIAEASTFGFTSLRDEMYARAATSLGRPSALHVVARECQDFCV